MFLPEDGNSLLRWWHSESVEKDAPELPGRIQELMFSELTEHRSQRVQEQAQTMKHLQREKKAAEDRAQMLQAEKDDLKAEKEKLKAQVATLEGRKRKHAASSASETD